MYRMSLGSSPMHRPLIKQDSPNRWRKNGVLSGTDYIRNNVLRSFFSSVSVMSKCRAPFFFFFFFLSVLHTPMSASIVWDIRYTGVEDRHTPNVSKGGNFFFFLLINQKIKGKYIIIIIIRMRILLVVEMVRS